MATNHAVILVIVPDQCTFPISANVHTALGRKQKPVGATNSPCTPIRVILVFGLSAAVLGLTRTCIVV